MLFIAIPVDFQDPPDSLFTVEVHSGLGLALMKSVMTVNLDKRF